MHNSVGNHLDIEWYAGKDAETHPKRIKVKGVWEDVFSYEKMVTEDVVTKKRRTIFRCHIGDNRIIEVEAKRRSEEPRYYEEIKIVYTLSGDGLTDEKAERAAKLATEKYCSVGVMLREKAEITYEVRIR